MKGKGFTPREGLKEARTLQGDCALNLRMQLFSL
jgi:hypothetical protein